ncbi:hypothetical protein FLK61_39645 [Paenalkalicoccus suaedae]|uniref:Uncharacterized protein n=1 Tax=Paenalkalicoccus suaedae TaxID=2592382 RepID=A0A859FIL8_9BACI|nr:hypothetical protein [Paenalkalicoccus suaedae]QKS72730.1 hypothetical protein FLK61_39645 [Paenalkalicoccus suaedae]
MSKLFVGAGATVLLMMSACQNTEETSPPENNNEGNNDVFNSTPENNEEDTNLLGSASENDFQLDAYESEDDPNMIRIEFSYIGEEEQIEIYHYSRIMNVALEQNDEVVLGVPLSLDDLVSSELNRGEPLVESVAADSFEQDTPEPDQEYTLTVEPYYYLDGSESREAINTPTLEVDVTFDNE